ncbi:uncharacterized protein LOC125233329 [Leguminivora glycinivorella]|uniref:uncharacterized protein LOC125233329 n=1 Tax=Leguminivora glycinivorella TaxID=1035111 RepID=UPI00200F65CC|nr:uncharacterized protein LOC125233329 [Leguminivora glycinivorella]
MPHHLPRSWTSWRSTTGSGLRAMASEVYPSACIIIKSSRCRRRTRRLQMTWQISLKLRKMVVAQCSATSCHRPFSNCRSTCQRDSALTHLVWPGGIWYVT